MNRTPELIEAVFQRTGGDCHICHQPVGSRSYGRTSSPVGWEVDHSVPRSKGGTDRLSNLYPAHVDCNRSKGAKSTRIARGKYGYTAAPLSLAQRESRKCAAMLLGATGGGLIGYWLAENYGASQQTKWLVAAIGGVGGAMLSEYLLTA